MVLLAAFSWEPTFWLRLAVFPGDSGGQGAELQDPVQLHRLSSYGASAWSQRLFLARHIWQLPRLGWILLSTSG